MYTNVCNRNYLFQATLWQNFSSWHHKVVHFARHIRKEWLDVAQAWYTQAYWILAFEEKCLHNIYFVNKRWVSQAHSPIGYSWKWIHSFPVCEVVLAWRINLAKIFMLLICYWVKHVKWFLAWQTMVCLNVWCKRYHANVSLRMA